MNTQSAAAIAALAQRGVTSLPPLGIVLGSGLGGLVDEAQDALVIPYAEIPGFPVPSVAGHSGRLVVATLAGKRVALFQGRGHYYERGDARAMFAAIETFQALGGRTLVLTNAAGGLDPAWSPPTLAAIVDHINYAGANPLIGLPSDKRFVPLTEAYDRRLLATMKQAATSAGIALREGVYMWFSGPSFETPAEIRAAKILGADLVGMSTVPETLIARYFGLRVAAVSLVTNFAAGLSGGDPSHEETQAVAARGSRQFRALLKAFVAAHEDAP
ncbi:MAG: purine-nucleoside phosphorylase [Bradyrhizobium sp.]|nr:MAG: purine-nucleoside phosphorylase [Bradyrhizobium sp.]